jgi:cytochrome c oxidase subunit III
MLGAVRDVPEPDRPPAGLVVDLARYGTRPTDREVNSWLGMVIFLGSWAMMFAGLFFSYGLVRARAPAWPPADQPPLPLLVPGLNTAVIAASSAAVALALRSFRARRRRAVAWSLTVATALGVAFLVLQAVVWVRLWREGLVPSGGPYPSVFYGLTALHALHVLVGLGALAWLTARAFGARGAARLTVRLWGMYWHFVGTVWLVLYGTVYVI